MDNFFIKTFFKQREIGAVPTSTMPAEESPTEQNTAHGGSFGDRTVYASSPMSALTVSAWHRGLTLIGDTMGMMPVQYQRLNREGENFVEDISISSGNFLTYGTRLNYLLQVRPNPLMTAFELNKQAAINRIQYGNAFIYIERDIDGVPVAFWLASNGAYIEPTNQFMLTYLGVGGPKTVTADAADVIHLPNTFKYPGSILGLPTLIHAKNILNLGATSDALTLENAAKGGRMKIIVREDTPKFQGGGTMAFGRFNPEQLKKKTQELNDAIYDNDVLLLSNALDIVNISQSAQQQELLESRKFNTSECGRFLGVPKILLMDDGGSSYKSPEAATQEFYTRTISPMAEQKEQEYDSKLLTIYDFGKRHFHVCEQPIFRLDPEGLAKIVESRMKSGTLTVNEGRKFYDLPSIKGGDTIYLSTNLAELGSDKLRSNGAGRPSTQPTETNTTPASTEGDKEEGGK